jgi:hypothetical protein
LDVENLLQKTEALDFHFETAYLSVTYLDQFLSKRFIDVSLTNVLPNATLVFYQLVKFLSI